MIQTILSNFALILFILLVITGVLWVIDLAYWSRQRQRRAAQLEQELNERRVQLSSQGMQGIPLDPQAEAAARAKIQAVLQQPWWLEYSASFFPVILLVFCLRSFLYEPFKIPSSSMVPTLLVGDLILVNKFTYGIRLPIINKKIVSVNDPQRGDVMVFRYPKDPSFDYIKRVIGVPGDTVEYKNKRLIINGKPISYRALPDYLDEESLQYQQQLSENLTTKNLTNVSHKILVNENRPAYVSEPYLFPKRENCTYNNEGFICVVPDGSYFMMGDNRDNSLDSRFWGFVPDENIVGKAVLIWMNWSDLSRIGLFN